MATPKERLSEKIKLLNNFEASEILDFVEFLEQKKAKELEESLKNASIDDEPLTEDEKLSIKEAQEDIKNGNVVDAEEVWEELGL